MKVSPIASSSGQPGQSLGSVDVGRTADPMKMDRAIAIARGETPTEQSGDPQADRVRQNVRSIRMKTQQESIEAPEIVEETPVSTKTESVEQATVEATQPLSPQFAALAKQKRAFQLEKAQWEKDKLSAQTSNSGTEELIAKIKSQPLSVLQEHGVTYDQLTEAILNGSDKINPEIQELKAEIKALKEGVDQTFITKEQQQEEAALTEMLYEAEALAKDGEDYVMIRENNAYDKVLRLIHSTYKQTGRVLNVSDAMNKVETDELIKAEKVARINKVQSRIAPAPTLQQQRRPMTTLTARDTATSIMSAKARAIAAFNGTLKK